MKIGYARLSETDPLGSLEEQLLHLREYGCAESEIYREYKTGIVGHRPAFNEMMCRVGPGDEVVVWKMDRIGRSVDSIAKLIDELFQRGASLRTLGEGPENIDTSALSNTQDIRIFKLLARFRMKIEKERSYHNKLRCNPDRTNKSTLLLSREQVEYARLSLATREQPMLELCKVLGVSPPTLYSYVGPNGELRDRGLRVLRATAQQGR
jgi:DNA invertase Pin-like site-specific DNA recombinase